MILTRKSWALNIDLKAIKFKLPYKRELMGINLYLMAIIYFYTPTNEIRGGI